MKVIRLEDCTPAQRRALLAMVSLQKSIEAQKKAATPAKVTALEDRDAASKPRQAA